MYVRVDKESKRYIFENVSEEQQAHIWTNERCVLQELHLNSRKRVSKIVC